MSVPSELTSVKPFDETTRCSRAGSVSSDSRSDSSTPVPLMATDHRRSSPSSGARSVTPGLLPRCACWSDVMCSIPVRSVTAPFWQFTIVSPAAWPSVIGSAGFCESAVFTHSRSTSSGMEISSPGSACAAGARPSTARAVTAVTASGILIERAGSSAGGWVFVLNWTRPLFTAAVSRRLTVTGAAHTPLTSHDRRRASLAEEDHVRHGRVLAL